MRPDDDSGFQPVEELGVMTNLSLRLKRVVRRMPTAEAYDLEKITARRQRQAAEPAAKKLPGRSMFFRGRTDALDKDPFLQRLARLQ